MPRLSRVPWLITVWLFSIVASAPSVAQQQSAAEYRALVNSNAVYVVGGSLTGTNSALVWDMAKHFDDGYELRVVPIAGRGSMRTTEDILYLQGVDAGTVQADVLEFFTKHNIYPRLPDLLRYITTLHEEEVHVVVGQGINNIKDLEGKKVNFGPGTSGTFMTASVVFDKLGLTVEVASESYDVGLDMLRKGEIDAIVRVAGAPTRFLSEISGDEALKLLPIPSIDGPYQVSEVTSEQYPGLIPLGDSIQTISVSSILVAYNHAPDTQRFSRVSKLAAELRSRLPELKSGDAFHPKWGDVDFDKTVKGWTRWGATSPD